MKLLTKVLLAAGMLLGAFNIATAQTANHTFALGDSTFLLDGKPLQMISGEMHCTRIPREYWRERMKMAKAMGLNTVGTYVFWNAQEPTQGKYDFSGNNDIAGFIQAAKDEGLWVVLRPSPYVCAEWEFGGYPWWLLKDKDIKVRSNDPKFLEPYRKYMMALGKQLSPLLVTHGGNILMVQIENEYGSYPGANQEYLEINRKIFRDAGFDGVLFTCDGPSQLPKGHLPGYLPAVNGLDDPAKVKALINKYHDNKGPYYIAEWYPGWFDSWGKKHATSGMDADAKKLDEVLSAGISINMYMFHGGTTRDFMNGANMSSREAYAPQTSSYDYDAPLDEAGNPTEKFMKFREVIAKHLPAGTSLPPIPQARKSASVGDIKLTACASLLDNLGKPVISDNPLCFEDLDQGYGFVLYRTTLKNAASGLLKVTQLRDFGTVYLNGKQIGTLDRRLKLDSLAINSADANATLDILVENNGRINYGQFLTDNRQGITEKVTLNGEALTGWKMYRFPFTDVQGFKFNSKTVPDGQPGLYKGTFDVSEVTDTYLDMHGFGKGFVFLNGHNLGKYWQIGPQQSIYVPAAWLKRTGNQIVVFDELKGGHTSIATLAKPVLSELAAK